ncbi:GILT-like protein 3 isoform X1 [Teleopsis dalmanni]|uniref:GILT-like protein 3 isoform X1 n=1 Tax=Teleopsis dalmanni TaxID=139649 RepID=UPI0018CE149C|nr:GILT-like protein 3 isoform X1 [Teleopsis dalmanni]
MSSTKSILPVMLSSFCLMLGLIGNCGVNAENQLMVQVYYETLCPDSIRFICTEFYNSMKENGRLEFTDLKFIPYGKVSSWTNPTTNVTILYCQHGETECELNALHACIVENNSPTEQLDLINCLLRYNNHNIDVCAEKLKIDVSKAKTCKATRSTPDILKKYGDMTDLIDLTFVPSIAFDNNFDPWDQDQYRFNFDKAFCKQYKKKFDVNLQNCPNNRKLN